VIGPLPDGAVGRIGSEIVHEGGFGPDPGIWVTILLAMGARMRVESPSTSKP